MVTHHIASVVSQGPGEGSRQRGETSGGDTFLGILRRQPHREADG